MVQVVVQKLFVNSNNTCLSKRQPTPPRFFSRQGFAIMLCDYRFLSVLWCVDERVQ